MIIKFRKELRKSLYQAAPGRVNCEITPGCSELLPVWSWKSQKTETAQFDCWLSSWWKCFFFSQFWTSLVLVYALSYLLSSLCCEELGSIIFTVSSLASKGCYQVPAEPSLPQAESGPSLHLSPQGSWSSSLYLSDPLLHLLQFNIISPVLGKPQTGQVPMVSTIDWISKVYGAISFPRASKSITPFSLTLSCHFPTLFLCMDLPVRDGAAIPRQSCRL